MARRAEQRQNVRMGLKMKWMINISIAIFAFAIAYGLALLTNNITVQNAILIAFAINWIAYIPAYTLQTEKFYDLTGSLTYLTVTWSTFIMLGAPTEALLLVFAISLWAARLGSFLFMRIHKDGEDKRFRTIKPSASQFFMTWTLQALWVSLCSMCALFTISLGFTLNIITYIGLLLFLLGFGIEIIADTQKTKFRADPQNKDKFITSGLWARSRHPNYFGEILLWFGIAVMCFPGLLTSVQIGETSIPVALCILLISPIFTYILLVYVSGVRMLEARANIKWGNNSDYKKYKKETPRLLPKL